MLHRQPVPLTHDRSEGRKRKTPGGGTPGLSRRYALGCGGRIRTDDLRVMSPTSCRCSTPPMDYSTSPLTVHLHGPAPERTRRHHGHPCRTERAAGPPQQGGLTSGSKRTTTMQTTKIRLAAVSAATLALAIAGTAAVAAHPGDREDFWGDEMGPGRMGGFGRGDMEGFGWDGGARGRLGGMFAEATDGFVRHETIYQTEDGTVSHRTDAGTVASTGEASLEYTLATGETASLTTDDATEIVSLSVESVRARQTAVAPANAWCQRRWHSPTSLSAPRCSSGPSPRRTARSSPSASWCGRPPTSRPMMRRSTSRAKTTPPRGSRRSRPPRRQLTPDRAALPFSGSRPPGSCPAADPCSRGPDQRVGSPTTSSGGMSPASSKPHTWA